MSLKQTLANEPVTLTGLLVGLATFFLVRYAHLDASSAAQIVAGVVPLVGGLIARQFVTPVRKLAAANPIAANEATTILRGILDALTINEPAVKVLDAPPLPAAAATAAPSAIPAAPEPWTPPALDIPPILGAMTATPAAAFVAPAPETPPAA